MPIPTEIQFDGTTMRGAYPLPGIDVSHKRIHEGYHFTGTKLYTVGSEIANGTVVDFLIKTGAAYSPHIVIDLTAGGDFTSQFFEGPTTSANGTGITIFNRNRNSSNTTEMAVYVGPTVSATGTALNTSLLPGGQKNQAVGGQDGGFNLEMVLIKSTDYLFRITNVSGGAKMANIAFHFYENRGR